MVLAIGNPFGVGQTVTMGIVSATGRNRLGINTFENFIQTDAAINPGNSGGALVDAAGNLVGINTAIFSSSGGYQGIGFAIPVNMARNVLEDILKYGRPLRGWLGIEAREINPEIARALGLKTADGVIITGVARGSPAHRAGLQPGMSSAPSVGKNHHRQRGAGGDLRPPAGRQAHARNSACGQENDGRGDGHRAPAAPGGDRLTKNY